MNHPEPQPTTIVVITDAYPYCEHPESVLVKPGLDALASRFDRIIVMPRHRISSVRDEHLRPGIEICDDLADATGHDGRLPVWSALASADMAYWLTHGTDNRHALSHSIQAVAAGQWFTRWLRRHPDLT